MLLFTALEEYHCQSLSTEILHLAGRREHNANPEGLTAKDFKGVDGTLRHPECATRFHEKLLSIHLSKGPAGDAIKHMLFRHVHIIFSGTA